MIDRMLTSLTSLLPDDRGLTPQAVRLLRSERIEAIRRVTIPMMAASIVNALIIAIAFRGSGHHLLLAYWAAGLLFACVVTFVEAWRRRNRPARGGRRSVCRAVSNAALMGALWAAPLPSLVSTAEPGELVLLTGLAAGMMAGGSFALSSLPGAMLAWLVALGVGTIVATVLRPDISHAVSAMIVVYMAAMALNALHQSRAFTRLFRERHALAERNEIVSLLLADHESEGADRMWSTDAAGEIVRASPSLETAFGNRATDGSLLAGLSLAVGPRGADMVARLEAAMRARERFTDIELAVRSVTEGTERVVILRGTPQMANGTFNGYRGIATDVTRARADERRIRYLADHDAGTALRNGTALARELAAWWSGSRDFVLVCAEAEGLDRINLAHGRDVGKAVLKTLARRLDALAAEANGFAAHIGGTEFALAVPCDGAVAARGTGAHVGRLALNAINDPVPIAHGTVALTGSCGFAIAPLDAAGTDELLNCAGLALSSAKRESRPSLRVRGHDRTLDREQSDRLAVERDIAEALSRDELHLTFQPVVASQDGTTQNVAMEALLRWTHPMRGSVPPNVFIPVAERTGVIVRIGDWVMRRACAEAAAWHEPLNVSVNVSPVQLFDDEFVSSVMGALADSGLPPQRLEIELTESVLIGDHERISAVIRMLRSMGVSFALDDFGTGFSSLSYLRDFKFDRIKIDQSFVHALATLDGADDEAPRALVRAIVEMGRSLGLAITAEGVELAEQAKVLDALGCSTHQGFLYSRPLTADVAAALTGGTGTGHARVA